MTAHKTIELPIIDIGVDTTELDKHIADGWKIVAVAPETHEQIVRVRLEKEGTYGAPIL